MLEGDIVIPSCGTGTERSEEINNIVNEFINAHHNEDSVTVQIPDSSPTKGGYEYSTESSGPSFSGSNNDRNREARNRSSQQSNTISPRLESIGSSSEVGPAKLDVIDQDDLGKLSIDGSKSGIFKHISQVGKMFGQIEDWGLLLYESPLNGLAFTNSPSNLGEVLFEEKTLDTLDNPICTMTESGGKTSIKVMVGVYANIYSDYVIKVQPNVFVEGCDWPIMNVLKVADGHDPESLQIMFDSRTRQVPAGENFSLISDTEGNTGDLEGDGNLNKVTDDSGNEVSGANTIRDEVRSKNKNINEFFVSKNELKQLQQGGVHRMKVKGRCRDSFGQEQVASRDITLANTSSEIKMTNERNFIMYDPAKTHPLSFKFDYKDCSSTAVGSGVTHTTKLQRNNGGTWEDVVNTSQTINNDVLPAGLSNNEELRIKVQSSAGSKSKDFFIDVDFVEKPPKLIIDDIKNFIKADEDFSYTFTTKNFENLEDLSMATLFFLCSGSDGSQCQTSSTPATELDFNTFYDSSTNTLRVPAGIFKIDSCYSISIMASVGSLTTTSNVELFIAGSSITQVLDIKFNFNENDYRDPEKKGHLSCNLFDTSEEPVKFYKPNEYNVDSVKLLDSSDSKVDKTGLTTSNNRIEYTKDGLDKNTVYKMLCSLSLKSDSNAKGKGVQEFTTKAGVVVSTSVTPSSGTELTKFSFKISHSSGKSAYCWLVIWDVDKNEQIKLLGERKQVAASSESTITKYIPQTANKDSTTLKVICESVDGNDFGSKTISVAVSKYDGEDSSQLRQEQAQSFISELLATEMSNPAIGEELLIQASENTGFMASLSAAEAQSTCEKLSAVLEEVSSNIDITDDRQVQQMVSYIDAVSEMARAGGVCQRLNEAMLKAIESLYGTSDDEVDLSTLTGLSNVKKGLLEKDLNQLGNKIKVQ